MKNAEPSTPTIAKQIGIATVLFTLIALSLFPDLYGSPNAARSDRKWPASSL
jgi:hypothetical protein